ncbi:MAG: cupin domain-containing protein [Microcoleus sp.]
MENGTVYTELDQIVSILTTVGLQLNYWPVGDSPEIKALLNKAFLNEDEKEELLQYIDDYFIHLKEKGYLRRDLVVLHPDLPNLSNLLKEYGACHTHTDETIRYVIEGESSVGFLLSDGKQARLQLYPGESITIPTNVEHWFHPTVSPRLKLVRYFNKNDNGVPVGTETIIRLSGKVTH